MLAYVFWHAPRRNGDPAGYEQRIAEFHASLLGAPPTGLVCSATFAVDSVPWMPGSAYEDWYVVSDWGDLGQLNDAAVDPVRREAHDAVAAAAADGAGAVYRLRAGRPLVEDVPTALWLSKPDGASYPAFREQLARTAGEHGSAWERQLVLGPAPEFCVFVESGPASAPVAATVVHRRRVAGGLVGG